MINRILHLVIVFFIACPLWGQAFENQPSISGRSNYDALKFSQSTAYFSTLMCEVNQNNDLRNALLCKACTSKKEMEFYVKNVRAKLKKLAGPFPERTDVKGKVCGIRQCDGFRIEKIIFQSKPGRYVTAHLYLPDHISEPVPACIEMCGHGLQGKGSFSESAARVAMNGMASMVVDPLSQGERLQLMDDQGEALTRGVTTEHTLIAVPYNLIGTSLAAQEYWDNSRAIDYLLTREDIDGNRIGCYGFSGGGTQSAYLMALDDRIKAGCIGLFFSNRARTYDIQGPSDGCQWMPGEGENQIEIADFVLAMAPKPFLNLDGKFDFVDHYGALKGVAELRRCYEVLGFRNRIEDYYTDDGHGIPIDSQEKMIRFLGKWLERKETEIKLTLPPHSFDIKEMWCTASGQVNLDFKDALSSQTECLNEMKLWKNKREQFCKSSKDSIRNVMMKLLGLKTFNDNIHVICTGHSHGREIEEFRFQLNCEGQMPVPIVVLIPSIVTPESAIEIHMHEAGKGAYLTNMMRRDAVQSNTIIIAADVRGVGEMEDPGIYNLSKYWNREFRCAVTSLHLGKPIIGQRVVDIRTIVNFCYSDEGLKGRPIRFVGDGLYGPVLMHAAILDLRIHAVNLTNTLKTWRSYLENPMQRNMYTNVIPGVLQYYDLPDLVRLSKGRVKIED